MDARNEVASWLVPSAAEWGMVELCGTRRTSSWAIRETEESEYVGGMEEIVDDVLELRQSSSGCTQEEGVCRKRLFRAS